MHVYICMLAPTMMHNKNVLFFPYLSDEPKSSVILKPLLLKSKPQEGIEFILSRV
jgi:hypothetical protein